MVNTLPCLIGIVVSGYFMQYLCKLARAIGKFIRGDVYYLI